MAMKYEAEMAQYQNFLEVESTDQSSGEGKDASLETTPLFSLGVRYLAEKPAGGEEDENKAGRHTRNKHLLPQYSLLGCHIGDNPQIGPVKTPIMLNTRAPNSTFLCGSQGSGKSHTLSCILESCLLPNSQYGTVHNPLGGVAFHYDVDDILGTSELASLCERGIKVRVLVSRSNYHNLKSKYESIDGAKENLEVHPLVFRDDHLSIDRMHRLMAFAENSDNGVPLYVEVIHRLLREIACSGKKFNYTSFKRQLLAQPFAPTQQNMLEMRLNLLDSFMDSNLPKQSRPPADIFAPNPSTLTIIDLSDRFLDPSTVCTLFDITLGIFKQSSPPDGLIITLDEAHKYLGDTPGAARFTDSLLTTIRMQRHHGTRVVVATQEPTISGRLLDLCSTSIVHRFTSPAWFAAIKEHLAGASSWIASAEQQMRLFDEIVKLRTGESFVFSPASFLCVDESGREGVLGTSVMKMKTRVKEGPDSGRSRMAGGDEVSSGGSGEDSSSSGEEASTEETSSDDSAFTGQIARLSMKLKR